MAGGKGGLKRVVKRKANVASDQQPVGAAAKRSKKAAAKPAKGAQQVAEEAEPAASEEVKLLAGIDSDDDDDESDDDVQQPAARPMAVDKKTGAKIAKRLQQQGSSGGESAVLYLGHIPHGFYEDEMRAFFSQFGNITRLRLARNRKTGKSRHFAFIEFAHREVARVVAKSMDGYLMYTKLLVAKVLAPEQVHPATFKGCNKPFKRKNVVGIERKRHNKERTEGEVAKAQKKQRAADGRKRRKLAALGIEYEFGGAAAAGGASQSSTAPAAAPAASKGKGKKAAPADAPAPAPKRGKRK